MTTATEIEFKGRTISAEDVNFVCFNSDGDDDACEALIIRNYNVSEDEAWETLDHLWEKFGRE